MKKLMSIFFGCLLLCGCFFGAISCGPKQASQNEIYVAAFSGAYGEEFWTGIKQGFEKQFASEGYKVRIVSDPKIEDMINPQIQGGAGPDVVYVPVGQPAGFTEKMLRTKGILKLNEIMDVNVPGENIKLKDKFMDGMLNNSATNPYANSPDDIYMLPLFYSPLGLFYNKNNFVDYKAPYTPIIQEGENKGKYMMPQTWEQFLQLGAALNDKKLFVYPNSGYMTELIFSMLASHDSIDSFNKFLKYDQSVIASTSFEDVFNAIGELKNYTLSNSWTETGENYLRNQHCLLKGEALFMPCGTWLPTEMEAYTAEENFEYGFRTPFTLTDEENTISTSKLEQIYILKSSKKKDIAKKFLAYMFSDEAGKIIIDNAKGGIVPIKNGLEFAAQENSDVSTQMLSFYNSIYNTQGLQNIVGVFAAANTVNIDWQTIYTGTIDEIYSGKSTVLDWIGKMSDAAGQLSKNLIG